MTHSIECQYAECHDYLNVMLRVFIMNIILLSVILLIVIKMSVPLYLNIIIATEI
jgi:hypothetical protein